MGWHFVSNAVRVYLSVRAATAARRILADSTRDTESYPDLDSALVMDTDLELMSREALIAEVKKLRQGIRAHRDSSGHGFDRHQPGPDA